MKNKYYKICDPGHGWLKVTLDDICELGIAQEVSKSSYIEVNKGKSNILFYLEEDSDMYIFIKAYEAKCGSRPLIVSINVNETNIRDLPRLNEANRKLINDFQDFINKLNNPGLKTLESEAV